MKYEVRIIIDDDGRPTWLHDSQAEAALNQSQQETMSFLYQRYHSAKKVWYFISTIRAQIRAHERKGAV